MGSGLYTSGVVATCDGNRITPFFKGQKHASENLRDVLLRRANDLPPPIQMSDALSRNQPPGLPLEDLQVGMLREDGRFSSADQRPVLKC